MSHQLIRLYRQIPTSLITPTPTAVVAPYVGPGDVVSGAVAWWGLRAYTNSSIGSNAIRLREDGGNTEQDFVTIAGGGLNGTAISIFKGANNLFVVKLYDQTGNGRDLEQATAGTQPPFSLSILGARPAVVTASGVYVFRIAFGVTASSPLTYSCFAESTDSSVAGAVIGISNSAPPSIVGFRNSGDAWLYAGSVKTATAADNSWHAVQAVFNGASTDLNVDGNSNLVGDPGAAALDAVTTIVQLGVDGFGEYLEHGFYVESGIWTSAFSGGQSVAMSANQHGFYGA